MGRGVRRDAGRLTASERDKPQTGVGHHLFVFRILTHPLRPVRTDVNIPRAQAYSQTIFEHSPKSRAAEDIAALATTIMKGGTEDGQPQRATAVGI